MRMGSTPRSSETSEDWDGKPRPAGCLEAGFDCLAGDSLGVPGDPPLERPLPATISTPGAAGSENPNEKLFPDLLFVSILFFFGFSCLPVRPPVVCVWGFSPQRLF